MFDTAIVLVVQSTHRAVFLNWRVAECAVKKKDNVRPIDNEGYKQSVMLLIVSVCWISGVLSRRALARILMILVYLDLAKYAQIFTGYDSSSRSNGLQTK